jgi:hypothetical protein
MGNWKIVGSALENANDDSQKMQFIPPVDMLNELRRRFMNGLM